MLNVVKHLLFAMLLRPVQSANRCFTTFSMTNLFKPHSPLQSFAKFYHYLWRVRLSKCKGLSVWACRRLVRRGPCPLCFDRLSM